MLLDGRLNVEEFEAHFSLEIEREKFDTVGGYVVEMLGRVPAQGERLEFDGLRLLIVDADPRAVRQIRVFPPAPAAEA